MDADDLFDHLDALFEEGRFEDVEREAILALDATDVDLDEAALWQCVAQARFELSRLPEAIDAARRAGDLLTEAKACFHLWDLDEAARLLAAYEAEDDDDRAEQAYYLGLVEEFRGGDATLHLRRAAQLAPDVFREPVRLSDEEVDAIVREALDALPDDLAEIVDEAVVEVADLPRPHPDVDPLSLGLFSGRSRLEQSVDAGPELPPRIEIFRRNVERIADDREHAADELRITLLHEIAHHLGYDERGVDLLGLG